MGPTVPLPKILLNTKPRRNVQIGEGEGRWEEGRDKRFWAWGSDSRYMVEPFLDVAQIH